MLKNKQANERVMTSKQYVTSKDPNSTLDKFITREGKTRYSVNSRNGSFTSYGDSPKECWDAMRDMWMEEEVPSKYFTVNR